MMIPHTRDQAVNAGPASSGEVESLSMPSVALLVQYLDSGGFQRTILRLADGLIRNGHRVWVVAQQLRGPLLADLPKHVEAISLGSTGNIDGLLPLIRFLRRARPQILLSGLSHTNVLAVQAARLSGTAVKTILTEHAPLSDLMKANRTWQYRLLPWFIKYSYIYADAVVAVSKGVAEDLSFYLPPGFPVSVIHNPIVPNNIDELIGRPIRLPWNDNRVPGDKTPPLVIAVGRLAPEKRFDMLIEAVRLLPESLGARLIILGDGPEHGRLERLIADNAMSDQAALLGYIDNPFPYMRQAQVLALTSEFEGLGNVLVEAMACGTAVVSTDCPYGPSEILESGRLGPLVPVGDIQALYKALLQAIEAPVSPEQLRKRAADFATDVSLRRYRKLMESVMIPG